MGEVVLGWDGMGRGMVGWNGNRVIYDGVVWGHTRAVRLAAQLS